jgi:hypothetical protein
VTVFLGPLWVWAVWLAEPSPRRRLLALALVPVCILAWLVPVAASSGGLSPWSERMLAMFVPTDGSPGPAARQLASKTAISFGTLAFTLGPAVVLGVVRLACGIALAANAPLSTRHLLDAVDRARIRLPVACRFDRAGA